jgi:hypothetical protein
MNGRIGYRLLLRTANSVFKNDHYAIKSAKVKLREEFLKHRNVDNPTELGLLAFSSYSIRVDADI